MLLSAALCSLPSALCSLLSGPALCSRSLLSLSALAFYSRSLLSLSALARSQHGRPRMETCASMTARVRPRAMMHALPSHPSLQGLPFKLQVAKPLVLCWLSHTTASCCLTLAALAMPQCTSAFAHCSLESDDRSRAYRRAGTAAPSKHKPHVLTPVVPPPVRRLPEALRRNPPAVPTPIVRAGTGGSASLARILIGQPGQRRTPV